MKSIAAKIEESQLERSPAEPGSGDWLGAGGRCCLAVRERLHGLLEPVWYLEIGTVVMGGVTFRGATKQPWSCQAHYMKNHHALSGRFSGLSLCKAGIFFGAGTSPETLVTGSDPIFLKQSAARRRFILLCILKRTAHVFILQEAFFGRSNMMTPLLSGAAG